MYHYYFCKNEQVIMKYVYNLNIQDLVEGSSLDFYYKGSLICWADHGQESIQCITFNGTHASNKV